MSENCKFCNEEVGGDQIYLDGLPEDENGSSDAYFCNKEHLLKFLSHGTVENYPVKRLVVSIEEMPDGKVVEKHIEYEKGITGELLIDEWKNELSFEDRCKECLSVVAEDGFGLLCPKRFAPKERDGR